MSWAEETDKYWRLNFLIRDLVSSNFCSKLKFDDKIKNKPLANIIWKYDYKTKSQGQIAIIFEIYDQGFWEEQ